MMVNQVQMTALKAVKEQHLFDAQDHVLVAFSGGHDSRVLLEWLTSQMLPKTLQPTVSALYVNHHLRVDAQAEEAFVETVFSKNTMLYAKKIVELKWSTQPEVAIEEQARTRRYQALIEFAKQIGANKIVTAHHLDDQAETILYKLIRGGNITQLKGMQPEIELADHLTLIRPFLGLAKGSLDKVLNTPITTWITDSSNQDNRFARNRLRNQVIPELQQVNQQTNPHLVDFSKQLLGMEYLIAQQLPVFYQQLEQGSFDWQMPEAAIQIVLQDWLNQQGCYAVKNQQLSQAIALMRNQNVAQGEIQINQQFVLRRKGRYISLVKIG